MTTPRDAFLDRVRHAVAEGNRAGGVPPLPERAGVSYQGGGTDPASRFRDELVAAGGRCHFVGGAEEAVAAVVRLVQEHAARRVLLGDGPVLAGLPLTAALTAEGVEVVPVEALPVGGDRAAFFAAEVGVSGADWLIAETGSVVLATRRDQPRSLSLLPPTHIVVAHTRQLLPDLFDLFDQPGPPPACLSLITGPSKTGDIELRLVTGVHGPGVVEVVLMRD